MIHGCVILGLIQGTCVNTTLQYKAQQGKEVKEVNK